MFYIQNNKSTKNAITYAATKNKIMAHKMILNSIIFCVVGISILGFY